MSGPVNVLALPEAGPVALEFLHGEALISGIQGPVGSGKTTAAIQKCLLLTVKQNPVLDKRTGARWRKARIAVVRDTYPQLRQTVLKSWLGFFPKEIFGRFSGEQPITHTITGQIGENDFFELEMIFAAIGEHKVEDVMRGWELTALWLNEADLLSREVLLYGLGRIGRYPKAADGGCVLPSVFADFNAPDIDSWVYECIIDAQLPKELVEELARQIGDRPLVKFYRQPGGREPGAENLHNLPPGYYAMQMLGATQDYVRRMVDNLPGAVRHGQPVFPEFQFGVHVAKDPVPVDTRRKLRIGVDGGLTPAAVLEQTTSLGQVRVIDELVVFPVGDETQSGVGPTRFGQALRTLLEEHRYIDCAVIEVWADPATQDGTDESENEQSWIQLFSKALGLRARPAPGNNNLTMRLEACRKPMLVTLDGGQPGLLVSPRAKILRKALVSGYHYKRVATSAGSGRYDSRPAKDQHSHVADAWQYARLGSGALRELGGTGGRAPGQRISVETDYQMFGG